MITEKIDKTPYSFLNGKEKKEIELNFKPIFTVGANNFLYALDDDNSIHKIDSTNVQESPQIKIPDGLTTFQVDDKKGDLICARPADNSISIIPIKDSEFQNYSPKFETITFVAPKKYDPVVQGSNITISKDLKYIAYTCNNDIYVYTGPTFTAKTKYQKISQEEKITNLILTESGLVYYTTENSVSVYNISTKQTTKLSEKGVKPKFAFVSEENLFYILQDKELSYFTQNASKPTVINLTTEHEISMVGPMGSYIYIGVNHSISYSFCVYDLKYGMLCFSDDLGQKTESVCRIWGGMLLRQGAKATLYRELTPQEKVKAVVDRHRFERALEMAQDFNLGEATIAQVHREYGDELYSRREYDAAIDHYIKTVRFTEPSHVIAKYVDPHHAKNLARYLQAIPNELKSKQHTTLLFNCYTKEKAGKELEKFVEGLIANANTDEKSFDVETGVDVLKRNGYEELAEKLAKAYKKHSLYMSLLYERQEYRQMLKYIKTLPGEEVQPKLQEYGTEIISKYSEGHEELISFATSCCTEGLKFTGEDLPQKLDPSALYPIFVKSPEEHFKFLYNLKGKISLNEQCWNTLIELALRIKSPKVDELLNDPQTRYTREQVIIYLNAFGHKEGLPHQYEELKLYPFLLHSAPPNEVLSICKKYGQEMPKLWSDGLIALADSDCSEETLSEFLDELMETGTIPFLTILTVLRTHGKHSFAAVSKLVKTVFSTEQAKLREANEKKNKSLETAAANRAETEKLLTMNYVVQAENKCADCGESINGNAVHFLCGHSYHSHCVTGSFCPNCKHKLEEILMLKKEKLEKAREDADVQSYNFDAMLKDISASLFVGGVSIEPSNDVNELNDVETLLKKIKIQSQE